MMTRILVGAINIQIKAFSNIIRFAETCRELTFLANLESASVFKKKFKQSDISGKDFFLLHKSSGTNAPLFQPLTS